MMDRLQQTFQRLRSSFRRADLDQELNAELDSHLNLAIEENLESGLTPEEARREALVRLGGAEQARERHREARGLPAIETFFQDMRYAARGILKSPAFSAAAILTLAMGIAVSATMFSMVSGFLLQRPPGRDPDHVVVISSIHPAGGMQPDLNPVSGPNYLAWRSGNNVFESTAAADEFRTVSLAWNGQTRAFTAAAVSPNYFEVLQAGPQLGRTFYEGDDQPGRNHVVILSHELWDREFGSDASVLGRNVRLNREDYTVIGVMPASIRMMGFVPQLWMPLVMRDADQTAAARKDRSLFVFARLKPGVTLAQARSEMTTLARRAEQDFPDTEKGWGVAVRTLPDFLVYASDIGKTLVLAMTVVGFVLLIACANVAGLLLARAGARRKELAIRMSLGAGRLRIIRQLLTEGLMIAVLGGCIGLMLSYWGIDFLRAHLAFDEVVAAVPVRLDWNVLVFALSISLVSAVLCSLAPALTASRTDINSHLKDESRAAASSGQAHHRLRSVLVTGEIAAALFLLIGTGLLLRGIYLLTTQNPGFRVDHLLTASLRLDSGRYPGASAQSLLVQRLIPRLQQIPGAEGVAAASELPANVSGNATLHVKGQPDPVKGQPPTTTDTVVTTDFFRTAAIPLLRGRTFTETDSASAPSVVVVNQEFVHRYLQDGEVLGRQIHLDVGSSPVRWSEIIGVVGNVKTSFADSHGSPSVYEPFLQRPVSSFSLMVRSNADPDGLTSAMRQAVAETDIELPLAGVMSMSSVLDQQKAGSIFMTQLLATFALLALLLAAIGIYGLISYSTGQRTHEIAIRMALGAQGRDVRRMVLWQGLKMSIIGASIGLLLALPLPRLFASVFNDIRTGDPWTYVLVVIATFSVSLLATYIPARRASAIRPMKALHSN